ncbi:hypothetical protein ACJMK2_007312, partial [Sinanodonta woodiana]
LSQKRKENFKEQSRIPNQTLSHTLAPLPENTISAKEQEQNNRKGEDCVILQN